MIPQNTLRLSRFDPAWAIHMECDLLLQHPQAMNDRDTGPKVDSRGLFALLKDQVVRFVLAIGALLFIVTIGAFLFIVAIGALLFRWETKIES
jgi:hypothetical protein